MMKTTLLSSRRFLGQVTAATALTAASCSPSLEKFKGSPKKGFGISELPGYNEPDKNNQANSTVDNRALGTSALFDAEGNLTPLGQRYAEA